MSSETPIADALKRLDTLPPNEAQVGAVINRDGAGAVATVSVGNDTKDVAAAGGWTKAGGWFAAVRARLKW